MIDAEDKTELIDSFYRTLEFGTGGLRGTMGPGTNRVNQYVVAQATQGYANYLLKVQKEGGFETLKGDVVSVVVGHDCRNNGRLYAETVAKVFAANGIKAYVFDSLRPTPELSFALRTLGCTAGIVITASHNPKEYNGYKVYWEDGAQITAPKDKEIIAEVNAIEDYNTVKTMDKAAAMEAGLYEVIGKEIDDADISNMTTGQMSKMMPIMMFIIMFNLNGALAFYYFLSNIITVIQQRIVLKKVDSEIDAATDKAVLKELRNIKEAEVVKNKKTGTKITRISAKDIKKKRR